MRTKDGKSRHFAFVGCRRRPHRSHQRVVGGFEGGARHCQNRRNHLAWEWIIKLITLSILLGLGGGTILGPLFLELGVPPQMQIEEEVRSAFVGLSSCTDATCIQRTNAWWEQGTGETSYHIAPLTSLPCAQSPEIPEASHMITELWTQEQDFSVSAAIELNQVPTISVASSGVLSKNGSFSDTGGRDTQEPTSHVVSPSDSWFSSALFAFIESVPSSPAIAAESPLISKALQRISSFRTGQTPGAAVVPNAATGNSSVNGRRQDMLAFTDVHALTKMTMSWRSFVKILDS